MLLGVRVHFGGRVGASELFVLSLELVVEANRRRVDEVERGNSMVVSELFAVQFIARRLQVLFDLQSTQRLFGETQRIIEYQQNSTRRFR